ncbi:MAG TPA: FAD-linked oxidase C-terminal domain-containing protein [Acetobacteraceae bacterium]|nr:FAD-linked oxidase C-terminal domain-containing protein [Acetobacteraceae bacterium]
MSAIAPGDSRLALRLKRVIAGDVLFDAASRGRYATDASIYQVAPMGVVVPERIEDVAATLAIAREEGVPVLPRGGGTSQCGQTVNRAIVIDCSRHLRRILAVDPEARTATVEPGLVLGALNEALKPHQLFFPVDPSTHARATIGGMAGNNSCGSKSIRYGLMADNVLAIEALLADGTRHEFGPVSDNLGPEVPTSVAQLIQRLRALGAAEAAEIAARFPRQLRRVGGYNIDVLTPEARAAGRENLARLLVGSEGTLAFSAALTLKLAPIKPRKVVGICQFPTFRHAMQATRRLVGLDPEAVELVDSTMIALGLSIPIYRPTIERMLIGRPGSLLLVEFHGEDDAALARRLDALDEAMEDLGHPNSLVRAADSAFQADIATVREAGLNIMMSMKGNGKPVSFIEDCAVDLADLDAYTNRLNDVFTRHGVKGTWYAHASVGCLHVRPVLNLKDPADVATMRAVAEECFALVREYKGSHSGEHGDGIARSEFHEAMFGSRITAAFAEVKDAFDPGALFNPNRIVDPPRMDDRRLFRYGPDYAPAEGFTPVLDWSAYPGPLGGFLGAVEMCNNNGACRAFDAGVMCPSFRATREETHLTRGRANTLRLALTGQLGRDAMASEALAEAMALCVSCKACRRECPTGVDMARMKIEVLAARAARHGVGRRERMIAALPRYAPLAARLAPLANLRNRSAFLARQAERFLGIAARRKLPAFRRDFFRDGEAGGAVPSARGEVLLLADTFNRYFEPENLRDACRVLAAAGYRAVIPAFLGRPLCCGRTYLAAGLVGRAREEAGRLIRGLAGESPVIGIEPSCLLTLRDEIPALLPGAEARALAERAMLLGEFLAREKPPLPFSPRAGMAHVHGHCHQKSFGAFPATLAALRQIPDLNVRPIPATCCGMAGAFGYQVETEPVSRAIAAAGLLPALKAAGPDDLIVADGTSCRHQIADLAGRPAIHSVRVLAASLERTAKR